MNKMITVALIAGGLLLLDSPEAAAHKEVRNVYQPSAYYRVEHRRATHMPDWLRRDRSFRRWYKRTQLRRYRHMSWHRLYDIYRWERYYAAKPHRGDHYLRDHKHRDRNYRNYRNYRDNGDYRDDRHGDRRSRNRH